MSTFNGERYLRTQLDSIVQQTIPEKELLIRDDGSTDQTLQLLQEYAAKYTWIHFYQGANLGVQKSFFDLLRNSSPKADYLALADQDDEWLPEKLSRAVQCLEQKNADDPLLYFSDVTYVGENLEPLPVSVKRKVRQISFGNAVVQNICTGCTTVMNQTFAALLKSAPPVDFQQLIMHDWWFYLVASCFGDIFYDPKSYIHYRQHNRNVSKTITSQKALLQYRIRQLIQPRGAIYRQIAMFQESFYFLLKQEGKKEEQRLIKELLHTKHSLSARIRAACSQTYFRQKKSDDIIFRIILLLGKL